MQYHLNINVKKACEWGLDGQLSCLFSYLLTIKLWVKPTRMGDEDWYWIARKKILSEVPFLGTNPDTVYRQMRKLEEKGLIVINSNKGLRKTLIQITDKGLEWHHEPEVASENNPMGASENNPMGIGKYSDGSVNPLSVNQKDHKNTLSSFDDSPSVKNDCPHDSILDSWAEIMGDKKQPNRSLWAGSTRASDLAKRWKDGFKIKRDRGQREGQVLYTTAEEGEKWWKGFFAFIRRSPFLMGETEPTAGHRTFALTLDWLLKKGNFIKVLEYSYHEDLQAPRVAQPEFRNGIK